MPGRRVRLERLAARSAIVGTSLCLGLDPDPAALPPGFSPDVRGVEPFARLVLDAALPHVAAVKPNLAFYEAFGSAGLAALERIRARIPDDVPVLFDAKRGDIGTTAARQVAAIVDGLGADAVTLNPYLGRDAIEPFLAQGRVFVYALCRTSNPAAGEVQGIVGRPRTRARLARRSRCTPASRASSTAGPGRIGWGSSSARPRRPSSRRFAGSSRIAHSSCRGSARRAATSRRRFATVRRGPPAADPGGGLLVNVSRGIAGAAVRSIRGRGANARDSIRAAAADWAAKMPVLSLAGA